jgi:hypothetical protein
MNDKKAIRLRGYGPLHDEYETLATSDREPEYWLSGQRESLATWHGRTLDDLRTIWSADDRQNEVLTRCDLKILEEIQTNDQSTTTNALFDIEDAGFWAIDKFGRTTYTPPGYSYTIENPLSAINREAPAERMIIFDEFLHYVRKTTPLIFKIKRELDRVRPATASYLLDQGRLHRMKEGKLARHASFISGHAAQGLLAAINISVQRPNLIANEKKQLHAWAHNLGLRRIWGGLHYPSDNLGAWIFTLRLLPKIYDGNNLKIARSTVAALFKHERAKYLIKMFKRESVYDAGLKKFQALLTEL